MQVFIWSISEEHLQNNFPIERIPEDAKRYLTEKVLPFDQANQQPVDPAQVKDFLQWQWINVFLWEQLKWWVVSQVTEGSIEDRKIVVKHTHDLFPFDPTELFIWKQWHNVDTQILQYLYDQWISVPEVLYHFPDQYITIMNDLRDDGYILLQDIIYHYSLEEHSWNTIWKLLFQMKEALKSYTWYIVESKEWNVYERWLELRLMEPSQKLFLELQEEYYKNASQVISPDTHPKNIFLHKDQTSWSLIDFGRSHIGDPRYILPNYLAHIILYAIAWHIDYKQALIHFQTCIDTYHSYEPIHEELFCKYLVMEIAHRAFGKRVDGITTADQKSKNVQLVLHTIAWNNFSINAIKEIFIRICKTT